jgi:hypothetical protein
VRFNASSLSAQFGIENIAQTVAQKVNAEYRDEDRHARKDR